MDNVKILLVRNMRKLTIEEINLLNSDLIPLEQFLIKNHLFKKKVKDKYNGITFFAENKKNLKGANGFTQLNPQTRKKEIIILDSAIKDDNKRSNILYHELGHQLMGLKSYNEQDLIQKVLSYIVEIKKRYKKEVTENTLTYLSGFKCLEEYLVEKFSQTMQSICKRIDINKKEALYCPKICDNYHYFATIKNKYGIFETICDELINKTFGNIGIAIEKGLTEEYFETFFTKFDKKSIIKILSNLGKVYEKLMIYSGMKEDYYTDYSPQEIKQVLLETDFLVHNIQPKEQDNSSHRRK